MLLQDSTIAWFRLKDGYKQAISTIKLKIAPGFFAVAFLYGGVALASHYIFNIRDSFGDFCQPGPQGEQARSLHAGRDGAVHPGGRRRTSRHLHEACAVKTEFDTRNACTSTKVKVFAAQTYTFDISRRTNGHFSAPPRAQAECR